MANKLCLYCSQPGHIASSCPLSQHPYPGTSVCQLRTTPEDDTSIHRQLEDLNINTVTLFNVINKMIVNSKPEDKSF